MSSVQLAPPPSGLFECDGQYVHRRTGFADPRCLDCRNGHRVLAGYMREDGGVRCQRSRESCGAMLYILALRPGGERWLFAADCTREELTYWEENHFGVPEVLAWLGAVFPPFHTER